MERKIFKGTLAAGNTYLTDALFYTSDVLTLEQLIEDDGCLKDFLENKEEFLNEEDELDFEKLNSLIDSELQKLFNDYNELDELGTYYSLTEIDNTEKFIAQYGVKEVKQVIELHKEYTELLEELEKLDYSENEAAIDNKRKEIQDFEEKYNLN